ncbi:MAG TPA: sulfite exporter TauE/SafE family protein [Phycisphaerae bacterium]|nr:sulfite exporter TauE/SafE family protein [Phycisphaerae bacterium]
MPLHLEWLLLLVGSFVAAALAAVTGFGGAAVLLPILVLVFGVRDAIPILTVAQLIGNASRVWFNRRDVAGRVVLWFALGGVPAAFVGGLLFARVPGTFLTRLLGVFLLTMVVYRRRRRGRVPRLPLRAFALLGAASSFLSALMGSVGPLMAPFFLSYGLVKASYIGTEALATVVMHTTKLIAYGTASALSVHVLLIGLALGPTMIGGSFAGKRIVDRMSEKFFVLLIELTLLAAGLYFTIAG